MNRNTIFRFSFVLLALLCCALFSGCKDDGGNSEAKSQAVAGGNDLPASGQLGKTGSKGKSSGKSSGKNSGKNSQQKDLPLRDNTPKVLVPSADGTVTYGSDLVTIDASNTGEGYVMVRYTGNNPKVKLQIQTPDGNKYTYLLSQEKEFETFPLPSGDGSYTLTVYENVVDDKYTVACSQEIDVTVRDEFLPFLYPNQYVSFTADSKTVAMGEDVSEGACTDLDVVTNIYHYVTEHITYDTDKATSVTYGYLPDIDETIATGKGICFDYASVMSSMLRSQRIPTKLEVGYAGEAYHAWISVYLKDTGWVDNVIEFDGKNWSLMDPTFAAGGNNKALKEFIGDGNNYVVKYSY